MERSCDTTNPNSSQIENTETLRMSDCKAPEIIPRCIEVEHHATDFFLHVSLVTFYNFSYNHHRRKTERIKENKTTNVQVDRKEKL